MEAAAQQESPVRAVPRPGAIAVVGRRGAASHTVTVKHEDAGASPGSGVFVRLDVNAATAAEAEAELRRAYCLGKSQVAAIQLAEQELARQAEEGKK